ncbi:HEAT repeat domain-containing protein [bacterium]|nr:HEAT repeat domain-containing protein [bacterium]
MDLAVRPQERRLVALLLAHSMCLGIVRVSSETVANALFIQRYGAAALPLTFILAALSNPLVGLAYAKMGTRLSFGRLQSLSLWVLLIGTVLCRTLLWLPARWPTLLLIVFYQTIYLLTGLEFWGLCSRIFDVRQAKRLFGLIGSGELAAQILLGLSIPLLLRWCSTPDLLLVSIAGLVGCLVLLAAVRATPLIPLDQPEDNDESDTLSFKGLLKDRYVVMLWAVAAFYTVCSYFVFQIFYDVASLRYPDESQLASFLGLYQALSGCLALLTGGFATSFVLERFGLTVGLLCFPLGVVLAAALILMPWSTLLLFIIIVVMKVLDDTVFDTLYRPAFQTLRQPLSADMRVDAQTVGEGLVEPIFGGLTGLLLLGLTQWLNVSLATQAAVLLVFALIWVASCVLLSRDYRRVLLQSLSQRVLPALSKVPSPGRYQKNYHDSSTAKALESALSSPHPGVIIYLLKLLREFSTSSWIAWLRKYMHHSAPEVRHHVLGLIDDYRIDSALQAVREMVETEPDLAVRGAAVRTLASLGGGDPVEEVSTFLQHDQPLLRLGAMVGLLKCGELEGIIVAGEQLTRLIQSPDPQERCLAARALGEVGNPGLYRPVLRLLQDPDPQVSAQALKAAALLRSPRLWPQVLDNLRRPHLRGLAAKALKAGGETVMTDLDACFSRPQQSPQMRLRLARIAGGIDHPSLSDWLLSQLNDSHPEVRHQLLCALSRRKFQARGAVAAQMHQRLQHEASQAAIMLAALGDVRGQPEATMLESALTYQLQLRRDDILLLLSLLYDPEVLQRVRSNLGRAAALEVLDVVLPRTLKTLLFPLLEGGPTRPGPGWAQRLQQIVDDPNQQYPGWVRACALQVWNRTQSAERDNPMLTTIEKVMVLKRVSLFAETPDEVLIEAADALEEVDLAAGRNLFEAGELGHRMYIIVFGQVKVHLEDTVLNLLGPGEIFGEMSLLDSEPRTASVTAVEPCRLLQLSQDTLYELMSDHTEVMRGIIRFLTSSLRARLLDSDRSR